jgi:hypothetical protein
MIKALPYDRVNEAFACLSGGNGGGAEFCAAAAESILCRVSPTASPERFLQPLCYAAGALAYYRYCLSLGADNTRIYKAGDISITSDPAEATRAAKALLDDALYSVRDAFSGKFAFISV